MVVPAEEVPEGAGARGRAMTDDVLYGGC